jgi:hypothetical protein
MIPSGEEQFRFDLVNLGDVVTLQTPAGRVMLDLTQDLFTDINNDGVQELRITALDYVKNQSASGALLRFELDNSTVAGGGDQNAAGTGGDSEIAQIPPASAVGAANSTVIFSSSTSYPFTLEAVFQGYCMFRWEIIAERDRRGRTEQYFQKTDELNIPAQNGIRMWVSNAAAIKLQVIGGGRTVPLEIGNPGEVVVAEIRWFRDDDGRYRLVLNRLES